MRKLRRQETRGHNLRNHACARRTLTAGCFVLGVEGYYTGFEPTYSGWNLYVTHLRIAVKQFIKVSLRKLVLLYNIPSFLMCVCLIYFLSTFWVCDLIQRFVYLSLSRAQHLIFDSIQLWEVYGERRLLRTYVGEFSFSLSFTNVMCVCLYSSMPYTSVRVCVCF